MTLHPVKPFVEQFDTSNRIPRAQGGDGYLPTYLPGQQI